MGSPLARPTCSTWNLGTPLGPIPSGSTPGYIHKSLRNNPRVPYHGAIITAVPELISWQGRPVWHKWHTCHSS